MHRLPRCKWWANSWRTSGTARSQVWGRRRLRRQLLHAPSIYTRQRIAHAPAGDHSVGRNLHERHQHEGALEQPRMRQLEVRLVHREVVVGDEVDVNGARAPALLLDARPPERKLDRLRPRQQRARGGKPVSTAMQALTKAG